MRRLIALAGLVIGATACVSPFPHSDTTLDICNDLGWGHGLCGVSLCSDYYRFYGTPCPDELRYGDGPR